MTTPRNAEIVDGSPASTASGASTDSSVGVSDNERKYYSIERAREVLGYEPADDSAEYHLDGTPKDGA